ncbi:hypothetical protein JKP88DRAFT_352841 [Tribonema minus]|uniref:Uncharacterized protein n=1 Tax=Tribonema minus TaxID=303371 RepID=A0A836CLX3_9STRA|nr:hypothetical protein JKP88DRAFT_352841 [Tribonema minus]
MAVPNPRASYPEEAIVSVPDGLEARWLTTLWETDEEIKKLIEEAKQTKFVKGIADGTLDPQAFAIYTLQDASYLASALPIGSAIKLGRAVTDYISFKTSVLAHFKDKPYYYALANYACFRLWPDMSSYLQKELGDSWEKSVSQGWIRENAPSAPPELGPPEHLADLIEACKITDAGEFDEETATGIVSCSHF